MPRFLRSVHRFLRSFCIVYKLLFEGAAKGAAEEEKEREREREKVKRKRGKERNMTWQPPMASQGMPMSSPWGPSVSSTSIGSLMDSGQALRKRCRSMDISESFYLLLELGTHDPVMQHCIKTLQGICLAQGIKLASKGMHDQVCAHGERERERERERESIRSLFPFSWID
jgi:hypothetical protein